MEMKFPFVDGKAKFQPVYCGPINSIVCPNGLWNSRQKNSANAMLAINSMNIFIFYCLFLELVPIIVDSEGTTMRVDFHSRSVQNKRRVA